jgi:DNA-binding response OmpR family regulator
MTTFNDSSKPRVAVLEDDSAMCTLLRRVLGSEFAVSFFESGKTLQKAIQLEEVDVVLLDIVLPGKDGISIAMGIRARSRIPLVLLSGLSSAETIAAGLNIGADDYVTKPFQAEVLRARLRNALRRSPPGSGPGAPGASHQPREIRFDGCTVDIWARTIGGKGNKVVALTERELQLLVALCRASPEPISHESLSRLASGREWDPDKRSVAVHISHLRSKLAAVGGPEGTLTSKRGVGYSLHSKLPVDIID